MKKTPEIHMKEMLSELLDRCAQGNVKDQDIPLIADEIMRKKRLEITPGIASFPKEGQIMVDKDGNQALIFPDGSIKEIS